MSEVLMGYKGDSFMDTGYFFAPYLPITTTPVSCRRKYLRYCQKRKAVDLLGNKCQFCGESDFWVLTFHHEDPSKKSLEMAAAFGTVSWKEIEREIKKCILLCIKCHMKHHMECEKILKIVSYYEPK